MDSEHRKIELQSPADLTFLQSRIRTAARQKLDLHLPPVSVSAATSSSTKPSTSPPPPDDLRRKTEDLVDVFVARLLDGMRQNVSINGMPIVVADPLVSDGPEGAGAAAGAGGAAADAPSEVETEVFEDLDNKLREKLRATVARRDALIGKIAQHRRATPGVAAARFREQFEREIRAAEEVRQDMESGAAGMAAREEDEGLGVPGLERQDEVERVWERAVEGLVRLNTGLPETRARLERAGEVVGYLEGRDGQGVKGGV